MKPTYPGSGPSDAVDLEGDGEATAEQQNASSGSGKYPPDRGQKRPPDAPLKSRLLTLEAVDHRTNAYRDAKQLMAEVEADLGGSEHISAAERQMIQHASVLGAMATDMEARYLQGQRIDFVQLCTILNAQRRCFDAVGYRRRPRDVSPSLEGYLTSLKEPK